VRISRLLVHFERKRYLILGKGTKGSGKLGLWMQQLREEGGTSGGVSILLTDNTVMLYFRIRTNPKSFTGSGV
jgi:hypothetical protein